MPCFKSPICSPLIQRLRVALRSPVMCVCAIMLMNENRVKLLMDLEDSDLDELISTSAINEKESTQDAEEDGLRSVS
ncbi:hypothetical protein TNCV_2772181 [Trichonephila clavipes]|nr:hypothetical protein TNCV_2772181 [Trichonephila clavipes]